VAIVTIGLPLGGVLLRAFLSNAGAGASIHSKPSPQNFAVSYPNRSGPSSTPSCWRTVGGAARGRGLRRHRSRDPPLAEPAGRARRLSRAAARSLPGLVAGLAFLWVFLFVPYLGLLRSSLAGLWLAYSTVWLAFGLRLISAALVQISPELEEAARISGAPPGRALRDVTLPLIRFGLISSWLLCFMIFVREYSTGVYLQGPGTEVLGPVIVSLFGGGALDLVAALSVVNVVLVPSG
jgi:iron(III) transport system permease protein